VCLSVGRPPDDERAAGLDDLTVSKAGDEATGAGDGQSGPARSGRFWSRIVECIRAAAGGGSPGRRPV
jgi:hypothetical protein